MTKTQSMPFFVWCVPTILLIALLGLIRPACAVHEEWSQRWSSPSHAVDFGTHLAVDRSGDIYVGAHNYEAGHLDYRLIKYRPDGSEVWTRSYDGPAHGDDLLTGLALDAVGNVYITGGSQRLDADGLLQYGCATLKYSPSGVRLWARRYDNSVPSSDDTANAIAVDAAGDAYVTGVTDTRLNAYPYSQVDAVTIKYSPSGGQIWAHHYHSDKGNTSGESIAVDAAGNAYVAGPSVLSCLTIKYSSDGHQVWVSAVTPVFGYYETPAAIAVDGDGNVYVAGASAFSPSSRGADYLTVKYDFQGRQLWRRDYGQGQAGENDYAVALALDPSGAALVGGSKGTVKYDADGKLLWTETDRTNALVVDTEGSVYAAGYTTGKSADYLLVKYGADGRRHWSRTYDGPGHGADYANALALDSVGNIYVTGQSKDTFSANLNSGIDVRTLKYSQSSPALPFQPIPGLP